ncbi:MAG: endonuclease/exonuclease/phosphatase family protein [Proteobacteria bacterium]|nr:endonuclease/exonuclease/phosphatase family protein [Pseudomonadota bacterium]
MQLRMATLNVWALPEPFAVDVKQRMKALGARLPQLELDLLALQEVWTPDARERLERYGRRAGLVHAWHRDASLGGSGLLVLSRHPLSNVHFEPYWLRGQPEKLSQGEYLGRKGFVSLELESGEGRLTLVNTHLHARYAKQVSHGYRAHRTAQLVQLALHCRAIQGPLVVTGDFNCEEGDPEYRVLAGLTSLRDVAAELDRRQATIRSANGYRRGRRYPDRRVDLVLVRDGADRVIQSRSIRRVFDDAFGDDHRVRAFSDHAGVLAELGVEAGSAPGTDAVDAGAVVLASGILEEGHAEAERRLRGHELVAGAGLTGALVAGVGSRLAPVSRRRFLRRTLQGAALASLTPGVGYSLLSQVLAPSEVLAFDRSRRVLRELEAHAVLTG